MSESYRPLVAVAAYHLGGDRVARWPSGGYGVPAPYLDALRRAGARTAIIAPGEGSSPEDVLAPFDGLLLVGGGDVAPARFGAEEGAHLYGVEPDRDAFEIALLLTAEVTGVPVLCICRGFQVMNVAFGGTLLQHLPDVSGLIEHGVPLQGTQTVHDVAVEPGSRLSAVTKSDRPLACVSHHHQGVDQVGNGLVATGRSPDGLVEALEVVGDPSDPDAAWILGVQWHPEESAAGDPDQQALFGALTLLARIRGSRAKPGETSGRTRDYTIADPDPAWPGLFEAEAARIRAALPDALLARIEHVGSTSVPDLPAKPIVDIQVSLTSMMPRSAYVEPLRALGYEWALDPIDDEHEFFSRDVDEARAFQIHVCRSGGLWERRHLAFRDWLRENASDAARYGELKRELAAAHPRDIFAYIDGKTEFIRSIEGRTLMRLPTGKGSG